MASAKRKEPAKRAAPLKREAPVESQAAATQGEATAAIAEGRVRAVIDAGPV